MTEIPRGITLTTITLRIGELIHMDFYFINIISIREYICVLNIVDARSQNKWEFGTPSKRPPLEIIDYFLTQYALEGRRVLRIRTDKRGELSKSAKSVTY